MSKLTTWIIIGLIAAIIIVVIVKAVQKSAATKAAAAAAQNQNTLAMAALSYKQQQDANYLATHPGAAGYISSIGTAASGFGSLFGGLFTGIGAKISGGSNSGES